MKHERGLEGAMDLGLAGKAALVTGASRGIGAAIAARGEEGLQAQADRLRANGVDVLPIVADLTEPDAAARLVADAEDVFGALELPSLG